MPDIVGVTLVPKGACPHCGHTLNAASSADGASVAPEAGDATVCIVCAEVMFFRPDMSLRRPNPGELMTMLFREPEWARDLAAMQRRIREIPRQAKAGA